MNSIKFHYSAFNGRKNFASNCPFYLRRVNQVSKSRGVCCNVLSANTSCSLTGSPLNNSVTVFAAGGINLAPRISLSLPVLIPVDKEMFREFVCADKQPPVHQKMTPDYSSPSEQIQPVNGFPPDLNSASALPTADNSGSRSNTAGRIPLFTGITVGFVVNATVPYRPPAQLCRRTDNIPPDSAGYRRRPFPGRCCRSDCHN